MKLKTGICFCMMILSFIKASAFEKDSTASRIFFTSYMGIGKVKNSIKSKIDNGFLAMTGVEYQSKKHHTFYGEINFDGYNFLEKSSTYTIENNFNTIALTAGYKYRFSNKKFSPYFKAGLGAAKLSYPLASFESNKLNIKNESNISFQYQCSLGLVYLINKNYGAFIDAGFQQYSTQNIFNNNLNITNIKVGILSAL